jgi:hypothetical protein
MVREGSRYTQRVKRGMNVGVGEVETWSCEVGLGRRQETDTGEQPHPARERALFYKFQVPQRCGSAYMSRV